MAEPMFSGLILAQPRKHRKKDISRVPEPEASRALPGRRLASADSYGRGANPPSHPTAALQGPLGRLAFAARIGENAVSTKRPKLIMPSPEKIPKIMAEKFAAITNLTDRFCSTHLNEEYRRVIQRVVGALARKRPSPLVKGKEAVWAGAAVHAVGRVNFLDDPSQSPHCKPKVIYEFFGIGESTGQNKSKEIRGLLKMGPMSPEWTLPSRIDDNPLGGWFSSTA